MHFALRADEVRCFWHYHPPVKAWQQFIHCKEEDQLEKLGVIDQVALISRYQGVGENILDLA